MAGFGRRWRWPLVRNDARSSVLIGFRRAPVCLSILIGYLHAAALAGEDADAASSAPPQLLPWPAVQP